MAIKSDDSDLEKTWLRTMFGGNGDLYVVVIHEDKKGLKHSKAVRVSTSGGYSKEHTRVKNAIAELIRAMENANLNEFPDGD